MSKNNTINRSKIISIIITLIICSALLFLINTYKISYFQHSKSIKNATTTPDTLNKVSDETLNIMEELNQQGLLIDSLKREKENLKIKMQEEIKKREDSIAILISISQKKENPETPLNKTPEKPQAVAKDASIGNGRKLIQFIPGTMGAKGTLPKHSCKGKGAVIFAYTVNKNGLVTHVSKISGPKSPCLDNTGLEWIKKYVKADKGSKSASGTYTINF